MNRQHLGSVDSLLVYEAIQGYKNLVDMKDSRPAILDTTYNMLGVWLRKLNEDDGFCCPDRVDPCLCELWKQRGSDLVAHSKRRKDYVSRALNNFVNENSAFFMLGMIVMLFLLALVSVPLAVVVTSVTLVLGVVSYYAFEYWVASSVEVSDADIIVSDLLSRISDESSWNYILNNDALLEHKFNVFDLAIAAELKKLFS